MSMFMALAGAVMAEAAVPLPASYAEVVLADSPLFYFGLHEAAGTEMTDLGPNGLNGTYTGSTYLLNQAPIRSRGGDAASVFFQGGDLGTTPIITETNGSQFSVEFWVRGQGGGSVGYPIDQYGGDDYPWWTYAGGDYVEFGVSWAPTGDNDAWVSATAALRDGNPHHVVCTTDGPRSSMKIYIDGVLMAVEVAGDDGDTVVETTTSPICVADPVYGDQLSDVAFYKHVLTQERIVTHFTAGSGHMPAPPTVPGVPTAVSATAWRTQANVSFTGPASNGGAAIDSYRVTGSPAGSVEGMPGQSEWGPVADGLTVTGLTSGTAYTFTVAAHNSVGWGPESSASVPVTPLAGVPGGVTGLGAGVGDSYGTGMGEVYIGWGPGDPGDGTVDQYRVSYVPSSSYDYMTGTWTTSNTFVLATGFYPGWWCHFTVAAHNEYGWGFENGPTDPVTVLNVPGPPRNVVATGGNAQASIVFGIPIDQANGITGYRVTVYNVGTTFTGTSSPIVATGLTNEVVYTFVVQALAADGYGSYSAQSNAVMPTSVIAAPGAPTSVTSTPAGSGALTLTFTAPVNSGGLAIDNYRVTGTPSGSATGASSPLTVTGLNNGTSYTFTVAAHNSVGWGVESSPSASFTVGPPGQVTNVSASTAYSGVLSVGNSVPNAGGGAIDYYRYTNVNTAATQTNGVFTGLTNGVTYTFTVAAHNAYGFGLESAPSAPVAPVDVPSTPENVVATAGNGQVSVAFTAPSVTSTTGVNGYKVEARLWANGTLVSTTTGASSPIVVGSLTNGTAYYFDVSAHSIAGYGTSWPTGSVTPHT